MKKNYYLILAFLFVSFSFFGQSQADIKKIIANYDLEKLNKMEAFYRKKAHEEKEKATVVKIDADKAPGLKVGDVVVQIDPRYFRPTEVETLLGDPSKAKNKLGWVPEITAQTMCQEMVTADLLEAKRLSLLKKHGYNVNIALE